MISMAFDYVRATSLDDAVATLKAAGGAGKLIAGGHSLVPLMKLWPPAMNLPPSPASRNFASASSIEVARAYSNVVGITPGLRG